MSLGLHGIGCRVMRNLRGSEHSHKMCSRSGDHFDNLKKVRLQNVDCLAGFGYKRHAGNDCAEGCSFQYQG